MEENQTIEREALGRTAGLGELYDARTDDFKSFNIFKTRIPDQALHSNDNHSIDIEYCLTDTLKDKFEKLDINGELSVSVLSGLLTLSGSAKFMNERKESAKSVRCTLYYKSRTKTESLNIFNDDLSGVVSMESLRDIKATHVVVGISWGANATISFDYANTENREKNEIEGAFQAHFEKMKALSLGDAKASIDCKGGEEARNINFKIRIFADIIAQNEPIPQTPEQALEFLRRIPFFVKEANDVIVYIGACIYRAEALRCAFSMRSDIEEP